MTPRKFNNILLIAFVAVVALVILGLYFGRILVKNASQGIIDTKLEILKTTETEAIYLKNKALYLENESTANKLAKLVPNNKDEVIALELLNNYARESGLALSSITLPGSTLDPNIKSKNKIDISQATPIKDLKGVYDIPIEVIVVRTDGSNIPTGQLLQLVEAIEKSPRSMRINSLSFDPTNNEININISLFVKDAK
jgi:hypothetical protein